MDVPALLPTAFALVMTAPHAAIDGHNERFDRLAERYLRELPALHPVAATRLGDHRFDGELDRVSDEARANELSFSRELLEELEEIPPDALSRERRIDRALLEHELRFTIWRLERLREWKWNPLLYTGLAGNAVYGLMAREFAPVAERLRSVTRRLEGFPRLLEEVRATLVPSRVPAVHAETAVRQNRGVLSVIEHLVKPERSALAPEDLARLDRAIEVAERAVLEHGAWLEEELLPEARGEFRLGAKLYDEKLAFTLQSPLGREEIRRRAESELRRVRAEMWEISRKVYAERYPYTDFPEEPSAAYRQAVIRACLEMAYADRPAPDRIVETIEASLELCEEFVRERDLVTVPPDPLKIILMPEFRRGVALAYCDAPGPLDAGLDTFYAVAPPPEDWTEEQVRSFLREYNIRSIHDLTIHEAMPGHFLQLAISNRHPSTLRAVLASGVFIEGWAVYAEQMMAEEGFLDGDPLMRLIALKWYLRGITNAIIDQAIHTGGMTREEALELMIEKGFQEEREAAGKWTRAQLTSAQLSTYFVGYQEHRDLRREVEKVWGDAFTLKKYHDAVLAHGSPAVQFVRAEILEHEIPSD